MHARAMRRRLGISDDRRMPLGVLCKRLCAQKRAKGAPHYSPALTHWANMNGAFGAGLPLATCLHPFAMLLIDGFAI